MADFAVILSDLLKSVGPAVCEQPGRVKGNLLDRVPDGRREVTLLMHALEVRTPQRFLAEPTTAARSSLGASLVQRMEDDFGTSRQLAEWAVQTWLNAVELSMNNSVAAPSPRVPSGPGVSPPAAPQGGLLNAIQQLTSRSKSGTAEARQKLDAGDYAGAIAVLEAMAVGLRDNAMLAEAKRLLANQQANLQHIAGLESQLNAAVAAHEIKQLRPLLVQLVTLDPARKDWRDALAQLPVPKAGEVSTNSIGMSFAYIPAGEFLMGAPSGEAEASGDERPQHRVKITQPFLMGVHQVTQGQFAAVLKRNPSHFQKVSGQQTANFPVEQVTWFDAIEFCNALSQLEGRQPYYQIANIQRGDGNCISAANVTPVSRAASAPGLFGYRLPTEAEWEYACRAGTTTPFHFGKELNGQQANVDGNYPYGTATKGPYLQRTTTVGSYAKNAFGLFDMHGNVWESCEDVYDENAYAGRTGTTADPKVTSGSDGSKYRVLRGGSWYFNSWFTRSAVRNWNTPVYRNFNYGFRVVFSASAVRTP